MKSFQETLQARGHVVSYIEYGSAAIDAVLRTLHAVGARVIHYADPTDYLAERRLIRYAAQYALTLKRYESPNFLCSRRYLDDYFGEKVNYRLTDFYIAQRKRLNILIEHNSPVGGKWTYDVENRKRIPSGEPIPARPIPPAGKFIVEAQAYVETHFKDNPGSSKDFQYAIDAKGAKEGFEYFLRGLFNNYGVYQDAILRENAVLFHALLTPSLNIGLLSPEYVIERALDYAATHAVPLNSLEGFIRQVLGWREFVRAIYIRDGVRQRTKNFWQHRRKIPASFYHGSTGIDPLDDSIAKVMDCSYTHHIERLMVLGNFMLLCEFDPDEVYRWFMELFIDAYDWVMVPNVYGMSQFADGGMMSTKPYISGSNYILKMSNYKRAPWCDVWDALFWQFIARHKDFFLANPRLSMMAIQLQKMEKSRIEIHRTTTEKFLKGL